MYRTHNNGQLRIEDVNQKVKLCGWVQKSRDLGGMTFIDLRDRYGITQLAFNETLDKNLSIKARKLNREWVIEVEGIVKERSSKNLKIDTGELRVAITVRQDEHHALHHTLSFEPRYRVVNFLSIDIRREPTLVAAGQQAEIDQALLGSPTECQDMRDYLIESSSLRVNGMPHFGNKDKQAHLLLAELFVLLYSTLAI